VTESDWAVMEDLFEDRNQRKDSAQRVFQTQGANGAKALRRKPTGCVQESERRSL